MVPFDRLNGSSYASSVVTMAVSCIVSEIKRDINPKRQFSIPLPFNLHDHLDFFPIFLLETVRIHMLLEGAKILMKSSTLCVGCTSVTNRRQTEEARGFALT